MINLHWWYSQEAKIRIGEIGKLHPEWGSGEPWMVEINGNVVEATEWTGHDPNDGWKPGEDAIYLGYGHLVSIGKDTNEVAVKESQIIRLGKAGNFTQAGLPQPIW